MSRVALVLAHDGTDFAGWQSQPGRRTVQSELESALSTVCRRRVVPQASGRTDSGVHAEAQVAHAEPGSSWQEDPLGLRQRLNALLALDLRVRAVVPVDGSFDARKSALSKRYRYALHVGSVVSPFTWRFRTQVGVRLDLDAMKEAARRFVGDRDFASLQTTGSSVETTRREVMDCGLTGRPPEVDLHVEGNGFLRHMIRAIAGCLLEVGKGRRPPEWIDEVLEGRDRRLAAANAPARGLSLESVRYPEPWQSRLAAALAEQERPHEPGQRPGSGPLSRVGPVS